MLFTATSMQKKKNVCICKVFIIEVSGPHYDFWGPQAPLPLWAPSPVKIIEYYILQ